MMQDIQDLLAKAKALGEDLVTHPTVKAYYEAQRAVRSDEVAQKLLVDYQTQANHIRQLEAEQKPVEVADKQRLKGFESRMAGQESLKTLVRAQADYVDLMSRVNRAIDEPLGRLLPTEKPA